MGTTPLDSLLFRNMFGTEPMRAVFSDEALIQRYLDVEAALARAQTRIGVIPHEAGAAISQAAAQLDLDMEKLRADTENVGYPILPLIHQLADAAGAAGQYVHWGATTQDIMDTATVLQVRQALEIIEAELVANIRILREMAQKYRLTPMAGRTHLQQALPVTFGYKAAVWLSMLERHLERLSQLRPRVLVVSFAGAAGTLASLGDQGLRVQAELAAELGLGCADMPWHVARDSLAEAVSFLGLMTGSLAKMATDISIMMSTEFGEVAEPFVAGRGASSTMPQKRNPISCELIIAAAKTVRQHVALMLDATVQDFERATGPWHLEWVAIPESFVLSASACAQARTMLDGLTVDAARMRANLDLTSGLIVAEAVMMAAAPVLGRQAAHETIYAACRQALENRQPLATVLNAMPEVVQALDGAQNIARLCDPAQYLGSAAQMVDHMVEASRSREGRRP